MVASKRVLVIDEDVEARRILRQGLESTGWMVDAAPDGITGLTLIQDARAYGEGYHCIITEAFLTDLDGELFIKTLRLEYPEIPMVVVTGFGDERRREMIEQMQPSAYFDKPVHLNELLKAVGEFQLTASTYESAPAPAAARYEDNVGAYLFLNIKDYERAPELYRTLLELDGVLSANGVRGTGFNLILRTAVPSFDALQTLMNTVSQVNSVELVDHAQLEVPQLSRAVEEFTRHYQEVAKEANVDYVAGVDTNAYLFIDIDRYQLERIYLSLLLTLGVIRCRVVSGGAKLVVLSSHAVRPNVLRHLLRKLAEMDGVRRVREARVINLRG
jgi:CheY-like chemotaxis protein